MINSIHKNNNTMETNQNEYFAMPRIGEKAPAFKAETTQGVINFPSDYAGHWVILFSQSGRFHTGMHFRVHDLCIDGGRFAEANTKLVGLSVDGLYSHIAWLRTIKEKIEYKGMKNVEVRFPLIEDITMEVSKKYGMIQPGESSTKAVRAVFIIDPKGMIRTIIYYPLSMGGNFEELYRAVIALQTADAFSIATPADWQPGDDVIVPTAGSLRCGQERMESKDEMHCHDWFSAQRNSTKTSC
jgi:peroxiredoxin 2/4